MIRRLLAGSATGLRGHALLAVGWVGVAVGAVALAAGSVASSWQPMIVAAAFFPVLVAAAVPGGAVLAALRVRLGSALAAAVVVAAVAATVPSYVADGGVPAHGRPVVLVQANLRVGAADPRALVSLVERRHADVLTVDELTPAESTRLTAAGLARRLPYHLAAPYAGGAGTGIWSRYPLAHTARDDAFTFELVSARVAVPGTQGVQLVAVHLLPPWPYASRTWVREMRRLRALLVRDARGPYPVLAAGDLNATGNTPQFRALLEAGYADAGDQAGAGPLPTYPTDRAVPPLLGLDHVLTRHATATSAGTSELPRSDHRALDVHLVIPGTG